MVLNAVIDTRRIGIFDSGLGGLSIWQEVKTLLPEESTVYLADHKNLPYGQKSPEKIQELTLANLNWLIKRNIKLLVIACNSATVAGIEFYRECLPNIPIVGVVPVIKTAAERTKTGKIAVLSTQETASSKYQKWLIKMYAQGKNVYLIGCSKLVPFVERGEITGERIEETLKQYLEPLVEKDIDTVILGCTHYPFLKQTMINIVGKKICFFDSGLAVARQIKRVLIANNRLNSRKKGKDEFYTTGDVKIVTRTARKLVMKNIKFTHL